MSVSKTVGRGSSPWGYAIFLFRKIRERCMDVTVNHWLAEFDPQMRSQQFMIRCGVIGNTTDFDSVVQGSNPCTGAKNLRLV